jgi:hypothetical protein
MDGNTLMAIYLYGIVAAVTIGMLATAGGSRNR